MNRPTGRATLEFGLDTLELLKTRELTREELALHFEVTEATVWRVLSVLVRKGFVRERELQISDRDRYWRRHYAAKCWSGVR